MKIDFQKLSITKEHQIHRSQQKLKEILQHSFQDIISLRDSRKHNKSITLDTQDKSKHYGRDTELLLKLFDQSFNKKNNLKTVGLKNKKQNAPMIKIIKEIDQSILERNKQLNKSKAATQNKPNVYYKKIQSKYTTARTQRPLITKRSVEIQNNFQPVLNYTMKNKVNRKIIQKRKTYFQQKKTTVFDSLHEDAKRYQAKRYLQQIIEKQKMKTEKNQIFKSNNKKHKHFDSFQKRLEKSIQKYGQNKKLNQKYYNIDLTSGKKLFQPNLKQSRASFQKVFNQTMNELPIKKINNFQMSHSLERLSQKQPSTTMRIKNCSSVQKISQYKKSTITEQIMNSLQCAIVNRYVKMFYNQNEQFFKRRYDQIQILSHAQYNILQTFFSYIQALQKNENINKYAFAAHFRQFYKKLNLYDLQILRDCFQVAKKIKTILHNSSKEHIEKCSSKESEKQYKNCNTYAKQLNYI